MGVVFCFLLCARLRQASGDAAAGAVEELARIVPQIRAAWPEVEIVIRADSGFCREAIMAWCESNQAGYLLGLAKNERLKEEIEEELEQAKSAYERTGHAGQPAALVVFVDGLCDDERAAPLRPRGNRDATSAVPHDPGETLQNRRVG
jgi:hypothetical protein